jgi:hypothetical protein
MLDAPDSPEDDSLPLDADPDAPTSGADPADVAGPPAPEAAPTDPLIIRAGDGNYYDTACAPKDPWRRAIQCRVSEIPYYPYDTPTKVCAGCGLPFSETPPVPGPGPGETT